MYRKAVHTTLPELRSGKNCTNLLKDATRGNDKEEDDDAPSE